MIAPWAVAFLITKITKKFWSIMLASVAVAGDFWGVHFFFLDSLPVAPIVLFFTLMFVAVFLIKVVQSYRVRYAA